MAATIPEPRKVSNHGQERWLLDLRAVGGGRPHFKTEADASRARSAAIRDHAAFGRMAFELSHKERTRYLALEAKLAEMGATLEEVIQHWESTHRPRSQKPLREAILDCLEAKRAAGRRKRATQQLGYSLNSFAKSIPVGALCSDATRDQIEVWLNDPQSAWSLRTKKNRLADLNRFFQSAMKRGWVGVNPVSQVEPIIVDEKKPGILTIDQIKRLLAATRKTEASFLPFIVLGIFCGVRPEEIKQLKWENVKLEQGYVEIPAEIAKRVRGGGGRQNRLIKVQPNALAWLKLGGELPPVDWQHKFDRVRRAAGFAVSVRGKGGKRKHFKGDPWPHDAMRHSFCSYCLPVFGELEESKWAGHTPDVAVRKYRVLVTDEAAKEFWGIFPE